MESMFSQRFSPARIAAAAMVSLILCAVLGLAGCNQTHADEKDAVNNALTASGLGAVSVSQDREKGVMTLTGDIETQEKKDQAGQVAKQAAPDYAISNQVGVRPIGMESQAKAVDSNLDGGIEDNCKAMLKAHQNLDKQSISCSAKNGTLTLSGSVKTAAEKAEAGKLAKQIPNVKETVNELAVKSSS